MSDSVQKKFWKMMAGNLRRLISSIYTLQRVRERRVRNRSPIPSVSGQFSILTSFGGWQIDGKRTRSTQTVTNGTREPQHLHPRRCKGRRQSARNREHPIHRKSNPRSRRRKRGENILESHRRQIQRER